MKQLSLIQPHIHPCRLPAFLLLGVRSISLLSSAAQRLKADHLCFNTTSTLQGEVNLPPSSKLKRGAAPATRFKVKGHPWSSKAAVHYKGTPHFNDNCEESQQKSAGPPVPEAEVRRHKRFNQGGGFDGVPV